MAVYKLRFLRKSMLIASSLSLMLSISHAADIQVFAAASLTNSLNAVIAVYEKNNPNQKVSAVYAGTGTLAKQIQAGAPADIFIAADQDWMTDLVKKQWIQGDQPQVLLSNQLVLIAPKNRAAVARKKIQLSKVPTLMQQSTGYLCVGQMQSVPAGKYALQVLRYYAWHKDLSGRVVETDDVRAALAFVERGECQLGMVYRTDALQSQKVQVVAVFPAYSHQPIVYPAALTRRGQNNTQAKHFMQFLQSSRAQKIFVSHGFQWVRSK